MVGCLKKREMSSGHQDIRETVHLMGRMHGYAIRMQWPEVQLTQNAEHAATNLRLHLEHRVEGIFCRGLKWSYNGPWRWETTTSSYVTTGGSELTPL
jgi:hypothetical protein